MVDDTKPGSPEVDEFYARYLETCRRLGVEPVSLERGARFSTNGARRVEMRHKRGIDLIGAASPSEAQLELQPHLAMPPRIDTEERYLLRLFLRRYVTWCARQRRFAQMQGAARHFGEVSAT